MVRGFDAASLRGAPAYRPRISYAPGSACAATWATYMTYVTYAACAACAACASCHRQNGQGAGTFPRLAGQHADYLRRQIDVFKNGTRANAPVMSAVAHTLDGDPAKAVAAWLQSR
ncbi:c-type cytochrome [Burkholderia pseudomallei]|uniref:Cytochrome c4 family protein n=3 Tax=Burkholderia pseudomallei TaxID=28450 RepID=Q3JGF7_BURP1|nr:cytochrome c4 family protein [Burkholderia pseudomallei 1710b]MXP94930.1 c-type cytochrome [Burkholderia pseudomallei]MXQ32019.1 c-type cytochrome [Burkholderia pseudomallei]RXS79562.1 c-type cytochrome [Burkholderia pseudomallei]